jgi:hypothetical protein
MHCQYFQTGATRFSDRILGTKQHNDGAQEAQGQDYCTNATLVTSTVVFNIIQIRDNKLLLARLLMVSMLIALLTKRLVEGVEEHIDRFKKQIVPWLR